MSYFDELPNDKPIMPPVIPPVPPVVPTVMTPPVPGQTAPITPPKEFKGLPVRAGGDRIFLLLKGKKYWVSSAEVYARLGFKFGDEVRIDGETLAVIPEGEPIT